MAAAVATNPKPLLRKRPAEEMEPCTWNVETGGDLKRGQVSSARATHVGQWAATAWSQQGTMKYAAATTEISRGSEK